MKLEFDVDVWWRPTFWVWYAATPSSPSTTPAPTSVRTESVGRGSGPRQSRRTTNGTSATAATPNRRTLNAEGLTSSSASWTSTNVDPYSAEASARASSGKYGRSRAPIYWPGQRLVIGRRRSLPKAFDDTRTPGGAWRRLYSAR